MLYILDLALIMLDPSVCLVYDLSPVTHHLIFDFCSLAVLLSLSPCSRNLSENATLKITKHRAIMPLHLNYFSADITKATLFFPSIPQNAFSFPPSHLISNN